VRYRAKAIGDLFSKIQDVAKQLLFYFHLAIGGGTDQPCRQREEHVHIVHMSITSMPEQGKCAGGVGLRIILERAVRVDEFRGTLTFP
jgi:hypothetical protein